MTVGVVALPLAMAFAIASGVPPERGLYTAIIAGFLISFLGGSRVQIGGPTGAFVVVVYSIVERHGYDGLVMATFIGAVLLIGMGLFRLGSWIKYIPHPLITGFTSGISLVIVSSQVKDFFGLAIESVPADFVAKWHTYFSAASTWSSPALLTGMGTLILVLLLRQFAPKAPWGVIAIVLATCVAYMADLSVETIQSRFGDLPRGLPLPGFHLNWDKFRDVIPDAITIAILAGIESLLSAVIADGMVGGRHKSNCELVAQGLANLGAICFGGIPATAAIARTATNVRTGAATPVAGMLHAIFLFLILFFFAPMVGYIPLPALAAVLMVVSWNMSEFTRFYHLLKAPRGDVAILLAAFFLTVFVDLTVAVEVGMILAAFLFMKQMGDLRQVVTPHSRDDAKGLTVYEMRGPLFFGVADRLKDIFQNFDKPPKVFVLKMRHVPILDATGIHALRELHTRCLRESTSLVLTDVQAEPAALLKEHGLGALIEGDKV
jgi:SulP family sulfate permease